MSEPRGSSAVSKILNIPTGTTSSTSAATVIVTPSAGPALPREDKKIENAIYAHIRALRALGRTQINSAEIAEALGLNLNTVHRAIRSLTKRGVKVL